jgi:hypothetical protein
MTHFNMTLFKSGKLFRRSIIAALSAAVIGLAFVSTAASARSMGGGGFRGGGGFHGFHGGFHHGGFGFRRFGPAIGFGVGLGFPYYASYYGDDGCLTPRRVWTPYGWRVRYVNLCGYY